MKSTIGLLILLIGCGNTEFTKFENKTPQSFEEAVSQGLEVFALSASQCREEKLLLVRKDKKLIQNVVAQIKEIAQPTKDLKFSIKSESSNQLDMIYQIITNDGFKTVVLQSADVVRTVGNNKVILDNLAGIQEDLLQEPGDRMAELITDLASDTSKQIELLGAVRAVLCDDPSEADLIGILQSPLLLWQLGGNLGYLMGSPLAKHGQPLWAELKTIIIPEELKQFVALIKDMLPKQDLCSIDNLDAYQKYFALALSLLKAPNSTGEPRPLRSFVNTLFKLYSMEKSNQCTGTSFDDLKEKNIQNLFLTVADFLSNEQTGVVGFLQKIKPRT